MDDVVQSPDLMDHDVIHLKDQQVIQSNTSTTSRLKTEAREGPDKNLKAPDKILKSADKALNKLGKVRRVPGKIRSTLKNLTCNEETLPFPLKMRTSKVPTSLFRGRKFTAKNSGKCNGTNSSQPQISKQFKNKIYIDTNKIYKVTYQIYKDAKSSIGGIKHRKRVNLITKSDIKLRGQKRAGKVARSPRRGSPPRPDSPPPPPLEKPLELVKPLPFQLARELHLKGGPKVAVKFASVVPPRREEVEAVLVELAEAEAKGRSRRRTKGRPRAGEGGARTETIDGTKRILDSLIPTKPDYLGRNNPFHLGRFKKYFLFYFNIFVYIRPI